MTPIVLILAGSLLAVPPEATRAVPLRLRAGQEFICHARYAQDGDRPGATLSRVYDVYVLILDARPATMRAAFLTVQRLEARAGAEAAPIARLEVGSIDPQGRVALDSAGTVPRLPIDAPPTLETMPLLELPRELPADGQPWQTADTEAGPATWRALKTETHELGLAIKLKGEQSSGDWRQGGRFVWRREETAALLTREGVVARLERKTDWRTPAGDAFHSRTVIDLEAVPEALPEGEFRKRVAEIQQALRFGETLAELMKPRGEPDIRGYDDLLRAIDRYPGRGTPYEAAVHSLRRQAELAKSGERPPQPVIVPARNEAPSAAGVGQRVADLSLRDWQTGAQLSLTSLRGQPAVLILFAPNSPAADAVLRYARVAGETYSGRVRVLPLALDAGSELQKLRGEHKSLPVYDGRDANAQFAGGPAGRVVIIDDKGTLQAILPGWEAGHAQAIYQELVRIIQGK